MALARRPLIAAALGVAGITAALLLNSQTGTSPEDIGEEQAAAPAHLPEEAVPPVLDLEQELAERGPSRSDSEIEDEARHPIQQKVKVGKGDTLLDLLLRAGVERTAAVKAIDALREVYNPKDLKIGQEVAVTFERPADGIGTGDFQGLVLHPSTERKVVASRDGDDFSAQDIKKDLVRQVVKFEGTIRSSLYESANAAGVPVNILHEMIRAMSFDVDFQRDLQPGDSFAVVFDRWSDTQGRVARTGELRHAMLNLSGEPISIYRWEDADGTADYYDAKGESVRKALLRTPVDGARLTSGFGARRHPILGYTKMHKGVDFGVATGTPVMAAGSGVVEQAGWNGGYGYYVRIRHSPEYATAYGHLSRFAAGIRQGKKVTQGQVVAYAGSTGMSTGPHLHYEILANGAQVNPLSVKFQSGTRLAGKELQKYLASIKETQTMVANLPSSARVASNAGASAKEN